jgi:hypothetical protein
LVAAPSEGAFVALLLEVVREEEVCFDEGLVRMMVAFVEAAMEEDAVCAPPTVCRKAQQSKAQSAVIPLIINVGSTGQT